MKKFGFNGEAAKQKQNETITSINRVLEMFQTDISVCTDMELEVMASILLEAGANYSEAIRKLYNSTHP